MVEVGDGQSRSPGAGYSRYLTPLPPPRVHLGVRLRIPGVVVALALLATFIVTALMFTDVYRQRSVVQDVIDRPGTITMADIRSADAGADHDRVLMIWTLVITAVLFAGWLLLARRNAQRYDPYVHHLATPWAFFGWVVPVVNLWFPYLITRDTLAASDREPSQPSREPRYTLVRAWWALWIVTSAAWWLITFQDPHTVDSFVTHTDVELGALGLYAVTAGLAAAVAARISASNDRYRAKLRVGAATASAG